LTGVNGPNAMTKSMSGIDRIKGIIGCGMICAIVGTLFNIDQTDQLILFAFGATYGGLWIQHD